MLLSHFALYKNSSYCHLLKSSSIPLILPPRMLLEHSVLTQERDAKGDHSTLSWIYGVLQSCRPSAPSQEANTSKLAIGGSVGLVPPQHPQPSPRTIRTQDLENIRSSCNAETEDDLPFLSNLVHAPIQPRPGSCQAVAEIDQDKAARTVGDTEEGFVSTIIEHPNKTSPAGDSSTTGLLVKQPLALDSGFEDCTSTSSKL
ncbi:hypothetical protein DL96DRAFT_1821359 [Flagelloscypha sp. PMI_526]|nr:hypothetical protein DL96DRAFT_1821359 [Flagelloscypha sp. PMI_526]